MCMRSAPKPRDHAQAERRADRGRERRPLPRGPDRPASTTAVRSSSARCVSASCKNESRAGLGPPARQLCGCRGRLSIQAGANSRRLHAGGGPDLTARQLAPKLSELWKQQVIVENRPGAGGTLAAAQLARAAAGRLHAALRSAPLTTIAPAIYAALPYDTLKDLAGITQTGSSKYVLGPRRLRRLEVDRRAARGREGAAGRDQFLLPPAWAAARTSPPKSSSRWRRSMSCTCPSRPFGSVTETMTGRVHFFLAPIANAVAPV